MRTCDRRSTERDWLEWLSVDGWRYVRGRHWELWREDVADAEDAWQEALLEIGEAMADGDIGGLRPRCSEEGLLFEASRRFRNAYRRTRRSRFGSGRVRMGEVWELVADHRVAGEREAVERVDVWAMRFWWACDEAPERTRVMLAAWVELVIGEGFDMDARRSGARVRLKEIVERQTGERLAPHAIGDRVTKFRRRFWDHLRERGLVRGERPDIRRRGL